MIGLAQSARTTRIRLTSRGTRQREETHMDGQDEQDKSLKRMEGKENIRRLRR